MAAFWAWQRRHGPRRGSPRIWPALIGGLAVLYASLGDGEWMRRAAIGWMMGSWGARLAIQGMYTRAVNAAGNLEIEGRSWLVRP